MKERIQTRIKIKGIEYDVKINMQVEHARRTEDVKNVGDDVVSWLGFAVDTLENRSDD